MHRALRLGAMFFALCACASHKISDVPLAGGDGTSAGGGYHPVGTSSARDAEVSAPSADAGTPITPVQYFTITQASAMADAGGLGLAILDAGLGTGVAGPVASAQITSPSDLRVNCLAVAWSGSCPSPDLVVLLSAGACPGGSAQRLALLISSFVHIGQHAIFPEPDTTGIRVRYQRPLALTPSGTWGTCASSTGQATITSTPSDPGSSRLTLSFSLDLGQCGADAGSVGQTVEGSLDVPVAQALSSVCP